jgi:hypothetical protein
VHPSAGVDDLDVDSNLRKHDKRPGTAGRLPTGSCEQVKRLLKEHNATIDFSRLIDLGCSEESLLQMLVWIGPYAEREDSQDALTGFDRAKLKTVLQRMRTCADDLDVLLRLGLTETLLTAGPPTDIEVHLPHVPLMLRLYANYVQGVIGTRELHPRTHFKRNIGISGLVHYVKQRTGKLHDKEVSSLISAVLNRPKYNDVAHRQWRYKHTDLIQLNQKLF